jgi:hypothetical protein
VRQRSKPVKFEAECFRPNQFHGPSQHGTSSLNGRNVSDSHNLPPDASTIAQQIAHALDAASCPYAIGGAIALGFWSEPRGTLDVDITLFVPSDQPTICIRLLQSIGCAVRSSDAAHSISEHGFCQVEFNGRRLDVFVPSIPFYEQARERRHQVLLGHQPIMIWDAETLCVFKMMFFRRKDIADVEQLLRVQGNALDRNWVLSRLIEIYGDRDPRVSQWNELINE